MGKGWIKQSYLNACVISESAKWHVCSKAFEFRIFDYLFVFGNIFLSFVNLDHCKKHTCILLSNIHPFVNIFCNIIAVFPFHFNFFKWVCLLYEKESNRNTRFRSRFVRNHNKSPWSILKLVNFREERCCYVSLSQFHNLSQYNRNVCELSLKESIFGNLTE